jgi:hypothetical protein
MAWKIGCHNWASRSIGCHNWAGSLLSDGLFSNQWAPGDVLLQILVRLRCARAASEMASPRCSTPPRGSRRWSSFRPRESFPSWRGCPSRAAASTSPTWSYSARALRVLREADSTGCMVRVHVHAHVLPLYLVAHVWLSSSVLLNLLGLQSKLNLCMMSR